VNPRLAVALLPLLLGGCGAQVIQSASGRPTWSGGPQQSSAKVVKEDQASISSLTIERLTCENDMRSGGTLDYFASTGGAQTPEKAARAVARPAERIVIADETPSSAHAYVMRADGSAHTRLDLVVLSDGTWRVDGMESCSGEGPGSH
jgi:hypothetical protein